MSFPHVRRFEPSDSSLVLSYLFDFLIFTSIFESSIDNYMFDWIITISPRC